MIGWEKDKENERVGWERRGYQVKQSHVTGRGVTIQHFADQSSYSGRDGIRL